MALTEEQEAEIKTAADELLGNEPAEDKDDSQKIEDSEEVVDDETVDESPDDSSDDAEATEATADDADEKPAEEEETEDIPKSDVEPEVLAKAVSDLGLSEDQANGLGNATLLGLLGKAASGVKEEVKAEEKADESKAEEIVLDPEEYDPKIIAYFDQQKKEIADLKAGLQSQAEASSERESAQAWESVDSMFDGQTEALPDVFGDGKTLTMKAGNEQSARLDVLEKMSVLEKGYEASGIKAPTQKELFDMSINAIHGKAMVEAERAKIASSVQKRSRQSVTKPTKRAEKLAEDPVANAVEAVAEKMASFGDVG